ncbi:lipoprotein [Psychrosphaera saromensis]|uniref:DUF3750 domain-containing protein n=1 Tax=Psychrosphaera saromensis TaxID=716813 RepID=A0A2S7UVA7_9GAMM|nr:DUF3750 domain-containing protein [Psychrosphaera saromensis]PQJ53655.1 hypothetical protein BTO11_08235 [Psychrosphaera saromensis]GHB63467.1 lipoprotein [Psychrosphaera saromensis]GLQ15574.1 lipoprotein [Psychrosphaera saromensis]
MSKFILIILLMNLIVGCTNTDWRTASRESSGLAPNPIIEKQAVIEFYGADAFSWRGWFAVHTWVAIKPKDASEYTVYEVTGWRVKRGLPALREYKTATPDTYWYGAKPEKILSITGDKASELIPQIVAAVQRYPWANEYTLFPGPNSNTFPTWLGLQVPELELNMPFRAIGSGFAD